MLISTRAVLKVVPAVLISAGAFGVVGAQTTTGTAPAATQSSEQTSGQQTAGQQTSGSATAAQANDASGTANQPLQPLQTKSNEGFWGHLNPLARKKYVKRQVDPVKDRLNELDQLTGKNASEIKDLDARSQAGIHRAQDTADTANQQATLATTQATNAQQIAQKANGQTGELQQTVSNLDQYSAITDTEIKFRPGQTALNAKAKEALDGIATQLQGQKGYIVEVQGFSHAKGSAGIASSQRMADAVVRYLVVDHQIPVYRIYRVALGNAPADANNAAAGTRGSLVHVTLMHNSLAALSSPAQTGSSPIGATQQPSAQPSPQGAASPPTPQK